MHLSQTKVSQCFHSFPTVINPSYSVGIYYEPNKEPPPEGPPKLHLLIESNEEWRVSTSVFSKSFMCSLRYPQVEQAVREIKRLLIEASAAALQAEMRNPTATAGRYSVV